MSGLRMPDLKKLSLGGRLSLLQAVMVVVVMGIFTLILSSYMGKRMTQRVEHDLEQQAALLVNAMSSYHTALADSAGKLVAVFRTYYSGPLALDHAAAVTIGEKQTPLLKAGATTVNLNTDIVDRFTSVTKAVGTVFVRTGDDFIRVSTSLKKEDGSRAVGTVLDRAHPAYQGLLTGR